jgi:phosphohistidine phosphatase
MNLYFMRHGIALARDDPSISDDGQRPLSKKSMKRTRRIAKGMRQLDIPFDALLTSPLARARQTVDIIAAALGAETRVEEIASLKPDSNLAQLLADLTRYQDYKHVLLVGHEPFLSEVLSFVLTGEVDRRIQFEFKKGAVCRAETDSVSAPQLGRLHWFMTSKQLRLLGKQSRIC